MRRWLSNAGEHFPLTKGPLNATQIQTALEAYQHHWNSHPGMQRPGAVPVAHQAIGGEQAVTAAALKDYFHAGRLSGLGAAMLQQASLDAWLERLERLERAQVAAGPHAAAAADGGSPLTPHAAGAPPPANP
jgi:hypothetical protein